jgi:hypothetical protein
LEKKCIFSILSFESEKIKNYLRKINKNFKIQKLAPYLIGIQQGSWNVLGGPNNPSKKEIVI